MNPESVLEKVSPKTKAIVGVHLFGHPFDVNAILDICEDHNLILIEDCAQAHGAEFKGKKVGRFGTGCFSFYATKNITTGEGGMIITSDNDIAEKCRLIRSHGEASKYRHLILGYLLILLSFFLSVIVVTAQIRMFRKIGLVVPDYYKPDLRRVPTSGGVSVLIVLLVMYSLFYILNNFWNNSPLPPITRLDWKALFVITFFGFFGLLDDYADVGRITKIILTFSFSLPLAIEITTNTIFLPLFGLLILGSLYWLLIVPTYIMVTSNLVNMHSGFNGMAVGLSTIIIAFLLVF